jgi:hypothetical protein
MSKNLKEASIAFIVLSGVLYLICAFSQLNLDPTFWSTTSRAVLGIGVVIIIIYLIVVFN